ncbi:MAG: AAA family ATPase [Acidobacteriota bacterium]
MNRNGNSKKPKKRQAETGITKITVCGFKSINREQSIEIRPLTILAGANSSGKSSIMQPLLLLKQTLEATYDPGPLLLNGPNVKFTSVEQFFSRFGNSQFNDSFKIGIKVEQNHILNLQFEKHKKGGVSVKKMFCKDNEDSITLQRGMSEKDILSIPLVKKFEERFSEEEFKWEVTNDRCFLELKYSSQEDAILPLYFSISKIDSEVQKTIHLPGLRGNPERTYLVTGVGLGFSGTFENYTASIIARWQIEKNHEKLAKLSKDLERLGLTWKVTAKQINDAQVEIQVGRLPRAAKSGAKDLVNIADVGFGVSQTLPMLVALLVAEPGQLVYIEEPEIHLHPRAQTALAQIIADAAIRGVRVVIETHSQLLLMGIQTLVAEGKLAKDLVKLHWFTRRDDGSTDINSADLDESGAFGDWPEDFAETSLEAQSRYLDAAEQHLLIN